MLAPPTLGVSMRHPSAAPSPLQILIAALPPEVLRAALLAVLSGVTAGDGEKAKAAPASRAAEAAAPAPAPLVPPARKPGWPKGRPRRKTGPDADAEKAAARTAQLARNAAARRAQRAAKRQGDIGKGNAGKGNGHGPNGGNGSAGPTPAERLWRHAAKLEPAKPWRAIAKEFGLNELDCYRRRGDIPPGLPPNAIERFLELPIPAG
jgi:hypothetical protein